MTEWLTLPVDYRGASDYVARFMPVNARELEACRVYHASIADECWGGVLAATKPDLAAMSAAFFRDKSALLAACARQWPDVRVHSVHVLDAGRISTIQYQTSARGTEEVDTVSTVDELVWWHPEDASRRSVTRARPLRHSETAPTMSLGRLTSALASNRVALEFARAAGSFHSDDAGATWTLDHYTWELLDRLFPVAQGFGIVEMPGRYEAVLSVNEHGPNLHVTWMDCRGSVETEERIQWVAGDHFPREYRLACFAPGTKTCVFDNLLTFSPLGDDEAPPPDAWTPMPGDVVADTRFEQPVRYTIGPDGTVPDPRSIESEAVRKAESSSERAEDTAYALGSAAPVEPDPSTRGSVSSTRTLVWGAALLVAAGLLAGSLRRRST